ncbi:MAG: hypothetical protein NVSMB29_16360 [Candidatus Dormibacteria bacterium]
MPESETESTPTAEPAGSDAEPDTGQVTEEKEEAGEGTPSPGYADFEPTTTPG